MHRRRPLLGVPGQVLECGDLAGDARAHRIHHVLADEAAPVGKAIGEERTAGVEEDARGLAGARREDDHRRRGMAVGAQLLVDVVNAGRPPPLVDRHLADHGVGDRREVPGRLRRRQADGRRLEVGPDRAAPPARRGPVAGRARPHGVVRHPACQLVVRPQHPREPVGVLRLRQDGQMGRDDRDREAVARLLRKQFIGARRRRRLEDSVGRIRRILQPLIGPVDADEGLRAIVPGREVLIRHGPVEPQPVPAPGLEVVGAHAEGDPAPVVRPSPEHPGAPPHEVDPLGARVGLAGNAPAAVDRRVVEAERFVGGSRGPERRVGGELEHRRLGYGVVVPPRLEKEHADAVTGEHVGGHPASRAGADDDDVVRILAAPA